MAADAERGLEETEVVVRRRDLVLQIRDVEGRHAVMAADVGVRPLWIPFGLTVPRFVMEFVVVFVWESSLASTACICESAALSLGEVNGSGGRAHRW